MKNDKRSNEQLFDIAYKLSSSLNLQFILNKITEEQTLRLLSSKRATIYLLDSNKEFLKPVATLNPSREAQVMSQNIEVNASLTGKVVQAKKGMIFNNTSQHPDAYQIPGTPDDEDENLMVLPLIVENKMLGTLNLYCRRKLFLKEDLEFAEIFTLYAGAAIQNALEQQHLIREIKERKVVEKELREKTGQINAIVNSSLEWIWAINLQGIHTYSNPAIEQILGYPPDKLVGNPSFDLMHEDDRQMIATKLPQWISEKRGWKNLEIRWRHKDGSWRYLESNAVPIIAVDGEITGFRGVDRDITESKQAAEKLKSSEERLKILFDSAPDAYYLSDLKGNFLDGNKAAENLLGYKREELIEKSFLKLKLLSAKELLKASKLLEKNMQGKRTGPDEFILNRKDGSQVPVEILTHPVKIRNKTIVLGNARDITKQKQTEDALKLLIKDQTIMLEISQSLTTSLDMDTVMQNISDRSTKMIGLDTGAIYLLQGDDLYLTATTPKIPADFPDVFRQTLLAEHPNIRKAISSGKTHVLIDAAVADLTTAERTILESRNMRTLIYIPLIIKKKTLGVLILATINKPRSITKHEIALYDTLSHMIALSIQNVQLFSEIQLNLSELKNHRNHLEKLVKERTISLEEANKELEAFAYSISHDLRAPLRAIDGFTRILIEDYASKLDKEGKRIGSVIQDNATKMGKLIDDLLSFSRMGRTDMSYSNIDMKNMVNAIYHEATSAEERKRIKFTIGDLPAINGDTSMMRQVWMNLISNAVKFSSECKQAVITVSCSEEKDKLIYCIKDNGAGFNMKYVDKLFGVFNRLHSEKDFEGTGVGLAIVRRIIIRHGGNIWAEGEVDIGAAICFSLPKKHL